MNQLDIAPVAQSNNEIFLGRQPILNNKRQTIAYELLFRSKDFQKDAVFHDDLTATSTVIVNMLSQFGIQRVIGNKDAFINISASLLMSETIELLPPNRIVLEILEDVAINSQILTRCEELKEMGFRLAIDHFEYDSQYDPLFPIIDFVKIDLSHTPLIKIPGLVSLVRKQSKAKIIAQTVENEELFEKCKDYGFDGYQGYFFSKPSIIKGKKPKPHQMALMRIMGILLGDCDLGQLEPYFKNNPSLAFGLLRLVNSVGISGARQKIESIRQAIVILGQKQLMRWVQLLVYASPDGHTNNALMMQVSNRARLMELIAKKIESYKPNFSDQAFMVGMLSLADTVMQTPLNEILEEIGIADDLKSAITKHEGTHGLLLQLAKSIEVSDFEVAKNLTTAIGISVKDLLSIQLESIEWAAELSEEVG